MVEQPHEKSDKEKVTTRVTVKDLIVTVSACTRCIHEKGGADFKELGPMIVASEDTEEQCDVGKQGTQGQVAETPTVSSCSKKHCTTRPKCCDEDSPECHVSS